jgi:hypothetical protein
MKYLRYIQNLFIRKSKNKIKLTKEMTYEIIYYNNVIDLGFNILKEFTNIPLYLKDFNLSEAFTNFLEKNYAENGKVHENEKIDDIVKMVKSTTIPYIASNIIIEIKISNINEAIKILQDFNSNIFYIQKIEDMYIIKIKLSFKDIYRITAKLDICENTCCILKDIIENYSDISYSNPNSYDVLDIEKTDMSCNIAITKESIFIKEELSNGDILIGIDNYMEDIFVNNIYIITKSPLDLLFYSNQATSINDTYYLVIMSLEYIDNSISLENNELSKEIYQKVLNYLSNYNTDIQKTKVLNDDYSSIDEVLD